MENFKKIILNPWFILFISGLFLNIPFFFPNIFAEFLAFFIIAPAFYAITKVEKNKRYLGGLLFFGAWILPTTYWYYHFMPVWLAFLASFGFVGLIAHVFHISNLIKKKNIVVDFLIIIISWVGLTILRINLPIVKDWWVPDIFYTQCQNLSVLQIANFSGIYGILFLILAINAILAYFLIKKKKRTAIIFVITICAIFLLGNFTIKHFAKTEKQNISLIAIQSSPENGYRADANFNDIKNLKNLTIKALAEIQNKSSKNIFVLWPENMITENDSKTLADFAKENNIFLTFNRAEKSNNLPFNSVVMINNSGKEILRNYKTHKAPGEKISIPIKNIQNFVEIDKVKITSDICYDLHYPDFKEKVKKSSLLFAPIDDDRFGKFMPYLHARDVIFRAIENRINILTASTNGPTFFVNKYGIIEKGPLEIYKEGYLILETGI
ncbi:MAG: hypothetical protein Q7T79_02430 [bacterium]|nr:hypothetical protein [bacterium]